MLSAAEAAATVVDAGGKKKKIGGRSTFFVLRCIRVCVCVLVCFVVQRWRFNNSEKRLERSSIFCTMKKPLSRRQKTTPKKIDRVINQRLVNYDCTELESCCRKEF